MARINQKPGEVSFSRAVKDFFIGYVDFKGRSTRTGYWLGGLIPGILTIFGAVVFFISLFSGNPIAITLPIILVLAFILPSIALTVRRFRDAGLTGNGILTLYAIDLIAMFINYNDKILLLSLLSSGLSLLYFVITVMPTDSLVQSGDNATLNFFFRNNDSTGNKEENIVS